MVELKHSVKLAIADSFLDQFSRLPKNIQSKVTSFVNRFKQNPTSSGINYETIKDCKDSRMRSVRIDLEYRAIILKPEKGNLYPLLWVDKHDDAYFWAQRRICQINQISGALQIIDTEEIQHTTEKLTAQKQQQPGRFDHIKDEDLMRLGVPQMLIPAVRKLVTDADVDEILSYLPPECTDRIIMLAAGYDLREIYQFIETPKTTIDPENIEIALTSQDSLSRFVVITEDIELEEMLAAPLEKWRVFLHPSQRKLVERDWNGPVRVLGGAGTGKTVVALHRAKWLVRHRFNIPGDRILFTTYTRNLSIDIASNLKTIVTPEEMERIKVVNLDKWVVEFFKQQNIDIKIAYDNHTKALWEQAYNKREEDNLSLEFYKQEWEEIIQKNECKSLRDYLKVVRTGRGTRLNREQRQKVWKVIEEYMNLLSEGGLREAKDAMRDAIEILKQNPRGIKYQSIIVDEAQDMSQIAFELIRAIVGPTKPNDIFIVGDGHQRIYGSAVKLSQCNIDIRGRSKKLILNYRTTDENRKWATDILSPLSIDDLDGGIDNLKEYRSLLHGEKPIVKGFNNLEQEIEYILGFLKQINNTEKESVTCIALRTKELIGKYREGLKELEIQEIVGEQEERGEQQRIRIATMHRVKGLQFDHIILPSVNADIIPFKSTLERLADLTAREQFLTRERCLVHVAATRAKKQILVTYYGKPSPFLNLS
ncbi:MAG: UvrD-helicase domain-containing protein [Cylindrospermopsis raciborskii 1523720]|uniref:UvrD-helicase domain-containing protein n=1 Tax=Cylindrospermopsis raciborskii TaxID=77022 RepID=UPI002B45A90F|nr:UvrD-helicase domain-containing protein [Cylindrospermopsis raciborskii]MEB3146529.1 UvrD-helicase domain-containing protein [Cylindrospermopsis raciborskii]